MSKPQRLRLAARITWFIGCFLTFIFIEPNPEPNIKTAVVLVLVFGIQYCFTQIESMPFEGALDFSKNAKNVAMWFCCLLVIALDIFINLGGINKFLLEVRASDSADVLYNQYSVQQQELDSFMKIFNFVLSAVTVVISEFLMSFADTLENRRPGKKGNNMPKISEHSI